MRNLTLNSGAGAVPVPAGTYGTFIANSGTELTLGVEGGTEPQVYNLQGVVLNGGSKLRVLGPVVINVASSVIVNGSAGTDAHVQWLAVNVASGGVTVNGSGVLAGVVRAPAGTVTVNGAYYGAIAADRLVVNAAGRVYLGH